MYKLWTVLYLSLMVGACSLYGPHLERPDLSVSDIRMIDGNFLQQNFLVRLRIQNPNDRPLPVTGLSAVLQVEGEDIATGVSNRPVTVPALGEAELEMTVSANMALGLLKIAARRDKSNDSVSYALRGKVNIDLPLLHSLPFQETGAFSLQGKNAK